MATQDEIFLKEIELERWRIRLENAKQEYDAATSRNYVNRAIVWANTKDIVNHLERRLETLRQQETP